MEYQVFQELSLNLTVLKNNSDSSQGVNEVLVNVINSFSAATLTVPVKYGEDSDGNSSSGDKTWFIVLIVIISVISLIALAFIVLWIRKSK